MNNNNINNIWTKLPSDEYVITNSVIKKITQPPVTVLGENFDNSISNNNNLKETNSSLLNKKTNREKSSNNNIENNKNNNGFDLDKINLIELNFAEENQKKIKQENFHDDLIEKITNKFNGMKSKIDNEEILSGLKTIVNHTKRIIKRNKKVDILKSTDLEDLYDDVIKLIEKCVKNMPNYYSLSNYEIDNAEILEKIFSLERELEPKKKKMNETNSKTDSKDTNKDEFDSIFSKYFIKSIENVTNEKPPVINIKKNNVVTNMNDLWKNTNKNDVYKTDKKISNNNNNNNSFDLNKINLILAKNRQKRIEREKFHNDLIETIDNTFNELDREIIKPVIWEGLEDIVGYTKKLIERNRKVDILKKEDLKDLYNDVIKLIKNIGIIIEYPINRFVDESVEIMTKINSLKKELEPKKIYTTGSNNEAVYFPEELESFLQEDSEYFKNLPQNLNNTERFLYAAGANVKPKMFAVFYETFTKLKKDYFPSGKRTKERSPEEINSYNTMDEALRNTRDLYRYLNEKGYLDRNGNLIDTPDKILSSRIIKHEERLSEPLMDLYNALGLHI